MKIAASQITLNASYQRREFVQEKEHLRMWRDGSASRENSPYLPTGTLEIKNNEEEYKEPPLDPKLEKIIKALEILTGKKITIKIFSPTDNSTQPIEQPAEKNQPQRQGWGIDYSYERIQTRTQKLHFSSQGSVTIEDGKKIEFSLAFSMQHSLVQSEKFSFKAGDALLDPLVVNFQNASVSFSNIKHNLDLDLDGDKEEFSFVGRGSGFLTLDKNNDGIVNDGSELFGPNSGDGFDDLRVYDEDGNGWIDENDAVFDSLRIWTKEENGDEKFYTLKDVGIGALYLESVTTPFEFQDGNLAQSSIFLHENGSSGIISELDLRV